MKKKAEEGWEGDLQLPQEDASVEDLAEALEDHCLGRAMDEGRQTPWLNRDEALDFLKD